MHYVPSYQTVPFKVKVQKALREILFIFTPAVTLMIWILQETSASRFHEPGLDLITSAIVGIPVGLALWFLYRLLRFTIGR